MDWECVIVAAGASVRMGGLWKPMLPFGDSTIIECTVSAALAAGGSVILVVGFNGARLDKLYAQTPKVRCVENPHWEKGLFSSVLTGIQASRSEMLFLMNGDKPLVRPNTYKCLQDAAIKKFGELGSLDAMPPLFAAFDGNAGHPVLVTRKRALDAAGLPPGSRMKDYLLTFHPCMVECGDEGVLLDIDTPEEYDRLRTLA